MHQCDISPLRCRGKPGCIDYHDHHHVTACEFHPSGFTTTFTLPVNGWHQVVGVTTLIVSASTSTTIDCRRGVDVDNATVEFVLAQGL